MKPETEQAIRDFSATAEGWCTIERALEMAQLVIDTKPLCVVEIGVFAGGSLIPQALALKEIGAGKIYGIDPWSREAALEQVFVADDKTPAADEAAARQWWNDVDLNLMHSLCMAGIWNNRLDDHAVIIRARSQDCSDLFPMIDVLYIDGSHSETASCSDVSLYVPRVRSRGWIWFDDAHWLSTQRAIGMLEQLAELDRDHESYRLYRKKLFPRWEAIQEHTYGGDPW